jgi:hypothetical protein
LERSDFIAMPGVRRCEQSLKRAKRNQRPPANSDRFQFALFNEAPNGGVAEPANLSSGRDSNGEWFGIDSHHAYILRTLSLDAR